MKKLLFICMLLLISCMAANRYLDVEIHPDTDASYVGKWTAAVQMTLLVMKIEPDGSVKYCTSTGDFSGFDKGYGKVFEEQGKRKIIFENGSIFEIVEVQKDILVTKGYGSKYTYQRGIKTESEDCKRFID